MLSKQISNHLRNVHFGGNWTETNFKDLLSTVDWKQATFKVKDFNSIATLTFHSTYFVQAVMDFMEGKPLSINDKDSFIRS